MATINSEIENQKWDFPDTHANDAINFSAIYQEYYSNSRVPELFKELVAHLRSVVESDKIDSVKAVAMLEKLIATIRKNATSDYFSTRGTWDFTQAFFKNIGFELIESIPGLKHVSKALRKTMSDLDLEFSEVVEHIQTKLHETVNADLPILQYRQMQLPAPKENNDAVSKKISN